MDETAHQTLRRLPPGAGLSGGFRLRVSALLDLQCLAGKGAEREALERLAVNFAIMRSVSGHV